MSRRAREPPSSEDDRPHRRRRTGGGRTGPPPPAIHTAECHAHLLSTDVLALVLGSLSRTDVRAARLVDTRFREASQLALAARKPGVLIHLVQQDRLHEAVRRVNEFEEEDGSGYASLSQALMTLIRQNPARITPDVRSWLRLLRLLQEEQYWNSDINDMVRNATYFAAMRGLPVATDLFDHLLAMNDPPGALWYRMLLRDLRRVARDRDPALFAKYPADVRRGWFTQLMTSLHM